MPNRFRSGFLFLHLSYSYTPSLTTFSPDISFREEAEPTLPAQTLTTVYASVKREVDDYRP